jgi:carbonic anhydrase
VEWHNRPTDATLSRNVRLQVEHLMTCPTVRDAVAEGRIHVHGLYDNLSTGALSQVIEPRKQEPKQFLKNFIFSFNGRVI